MYSATLCGSMGSMVQGAGCTVTGCVCPAEQWSSSMLIERKVVSAVSLKLIERHRLYYMYKTLCICICTQLRVLPHATACMGSLSAVFHITL